MKWQFSETPSVSLGSSCVPDFTCFTARVSLGNNFSSKGLETGVQHFSEDHPPAPSANSVTSSN